MTTDNRSDRSGTTTGERQKVLFSDLTPSQHSRLYKLLDEARVCSMDGVTIAGFELGRLYERGVRDDAHDHSSQYVLVPDESRAWSWYQRAADAGDPNALGRFAEREADLAYASTDAAQRKLHSLASFHLYAAAAERARMEDWPDEAWRDWRYRRASLARVLAQAGMMQEVAEEYARVRARYMPRHPTSWERLFFTSP